MRKHLPIEKPCPVCKQWIDQTSGYIDSEDRSHGMSWKCPDCGHEEVENHA